MESKYLIKSSQEFGIYFAPVIIPILLILIISWLISSKRERAPKVNWGYVILECILFVLGYLSILAASTKILNDDMPIITPLLGDLGIAILISAILGLTVDLVLKTKLSSEAAHGFLRWIGRYLDQEVYDETEKLLKECFHWEEYEIELEHDRVSDPTGKAKYLPVTPDAENVSFMHTWPKQYLSTS